MSNLLRAAGLLVLAVLPLYLDAAWLKAGQYVMIGAVAAIGLTMLAGQAGQLSLAHAFFLLAGATSYTVLAGPSGTGLVGLGWPPALALVGAVLVSALLGLAFAPVAGRLRGIYLGVASLSLVFIGLYLGQSLESLTGGTSSGRAPAPFALAGLPLGAGGPDVELFGVPIRQAERGWYLFLLLTVLAYVLARGAVRRRAGRAWRAVRDNEAAATAMGVDVTATKAAAFAVSSAYAGLAGVMTVLWFDILKPDEGEYGTYGINVSIAFLAMAIIGGLGSVPGAVAGAVIVNGLPQVLTLYSTDLDWFGGTGAGALSPVLISSFVYGAAIILVVLFEPGGLAAIARRLGPRVAAAARTHPLKGAVMTTSTRRATAMTVAAALALASCSTKADGGGSGGTDSSGVRTGPGVTRSEITLGAMTDKTGVFKNLGLGITQGNELWAKDFNAAGGVCGRKIKLTTVDHGYKADTAKSLYPQIEPKILGFVQLLGSPVVAALKPNLAADKVTAAPASWSSELLDSPYVMIVGTTYDVEIIDGLSYLQRKGLIKDGDTVGHIYIDGEYGMNGLRGSRFYAGEHRLTVKGVKVAATDSDMTNIVTKLKGDGVKAVLLTTSAPQTGSAAAATRALGLNVPILANNPAFDPALLRGPAAAALGGLYIVASIVPFSADVPKARQVAAEYKAAYKETPNIGVPYGYAVGEVWATVLKKACANKDLTRDGVTAALKQTTSADTGDLVADLDFSQPGAPPTRQVYVAQPDAAAEGGLKYVEPLFEAAEARSYRAPHQG